MALYTKNRESVAGMGTLIITIITIITIIGDEQSGFRSGFSTLDHIFVLYSVINYYLSKKKRVYCAFVDYKKAFDLVDRNLLWSKLLANNINGKMINVIHTLYKNAKSCVVSNGTNSDFFTCNVGVRQGENLSPVLFTIFLHDFERFISNYYRGLGHLSSSVKEQLSTDDVEVFFRLFTLLYADDTIVLAENEVDLQKALNGVHD